MSNSTISANPELKIKKPSQMKEIWRRLKKNKSAMIGMFMLLIVVIATIFADFISPYNLGVDMNVKEKLQGPSLNHLFGTDGYGRDLFSRCLHGSRISLGIGIAATITSLIIGLLLGATAGFVGGKTDSIIMRCIDVFMSIPTLLMSLAIVTALGASVINIIIAITLTRIPAMARIVRAAILPVVDQEYIEAAFAGGTRNWRIVVKHVLPNSLAPIIVMTTMNVAGIILQVANLSFLGLGINPPTPEWGSIISEAREFMRTAPHYIFFPGMCIVITALSLNLLGDGLRDALDPRLKS